MSTSFPLSKFQLLQPPTPPRDRENDLDLEACETGLALLDSKHLLYNTPDDSPNSTTESMGKSPEERSAKRVGFVLIPNNIARNIKTTSSAEDLKPRRSILKNTSHNFSSDQPSSDIISSIEGPDFPTMLEHMIKGLASQDFSARYDAYMSINGCLKTYKDMPAKQSLIEKMAVLDGYIRRDLAIDTGDGVRASQMVTESLKFVTSLCWFPETKSVMTAGFQVFLLNHTITVLGKEDTPKLLANLYLYLLSVQTFSARVMSQDKITRILAVLKGVATRIQGRQCIAHRLAIYKRLISQAKVVMANRAEDWIEDMLNNMLSKTKEVRERAIALGFFAGQCYGGTSDTPVADALRRLMISKKADKAERRYIDDVITRMHSWLDSKQDIVDIPSIWSVVILLLRSKAHFIERWEYLPQWLKLIQGCLNINDTKTRSEGNKAWSRFIYTLSPTGDTSKSVSSLLFRPLKKQLERQEREKDSSGQLRKNIDGAYITLLYYAFRPGTDYETLDRYWSEYIMPVFSQGNDIPIGNDIACRILVAFFSSSQQVWQPNRALETTVLSPEDLTRIDPRWLRSRAKVITTVLMAHIEKLWPQDNTNDWSWKLVWTAWFDAVKLASAKEVKVSTDAVSAVIGLVNMYLSTIQSIQEDDQQKTAKLERAVWIISSIHSRLGALPFLEERAYYSGDGHSLKLIIDRTKQSIDRSYSALTVLVQSTLDLLHDSQFFKSCMQGDGIPSPNLLLYLSAAAQLMMAGFRSLPTDIRHSVSAQKASQSLDRLQQSLENSSGDLTDQLTDLVRFAEWLNRRTKDIPLTPVKTNPAQQEAIQIDVPKDTMVTATDDSATRTESIGDQPHTQKHEKDHKLKTKGLAKINVTTPEAKSKRTRGSSFHEQPRIRHDNSQIEFACIDSSPSISKAMDSQLLTDRQKEVKDRQKQASGSLFRDVSSSSGPKSRAENTPRLQLSGRDRAKLGGERIGSSSPILPPADSMVALLGSSPTPNQRRPSSAANLGLSSEVRGSDGTSMMHFSMDDPPSSPPSEAFRGVHEKDMGISLAADVISTAAATSIVGLDTAENRLNDDESDIVEEDIAGISTITSEPMLREDEVELPGFPASLLAQKATSDDPNPGFDLPAQDLRLAQVLVCNPESEDEDLISSQIGQDLRHASQDAVMVETSKRHKRSNPPTYTLGCSKMSTRGSRKRVHADCSQNEELVGSSLKRIRTDSGNQTSEDIVTELEHLLQMAKSGMTSEQGLAILHMSAQLTQLAVQAVRGET